jgi:hypothetical protein
MIGGLLTLFLLELLVYPAIHKLWKMRTGLRRSGGARGDGMSGTTDERHTAPREEPEGQARRGLPVMLGWRESEHIALSLRRSLPPTAI